MMYGPTRNILAGGGFGSSNMMSYFSFARAGESSPNEALLSLSEIGLKVSMKI